MNRNLRIGDLIEVPPVQTVIRLEEGRTRSESIANSFVFTSEVASHFTVLADALLKDHGRGFFLQGDFGSGKSHFLAALTAWLSQRPGSNMLCEHHEGLRQVEASGRRFLAVDVSLVNFRSTTPLERILIEAIESALTSWGIETRLTPLSTFLSHFKTLLKDRTLASDFAAQVGVSPDEPDAINAYLDSKPREAYAEGIRFMKQTGLQSPEALVEERHETLSRAIKAVKDADFDGLVLLIDELSEFFRSKTDARALNEDARTLQLFGELTFSEPLWIIAAVQESIERTGDISQVTFQKIKDRFPVKFTLSTIHIKALISERLVKIKPEAHEEISNIYEYLRRHFPSFKWKFEDFRAVYPIHPMTISLLDGLGDLFSEHRGIVDFVHSRVAGDESRRINGILGRSAYELLGPDSIYEHFSQRMSEFSGFHVYPRHVVPHLDEVIDRAIDGSEDRTLARRIIRVLVLYKIHPTASVPSVSVLTELVSCALSEQDPSLNVQFISEAILDVLVQNSRFLVKHPSDTGNPLDAVYAVALEEDPGKTLKERISRTASEIPSDDTRLLTEAFADLPESESWPGPGIWKREVNRFVSWRKSNRRVVVSLLKRGDEDSLKDRIDIALSGGDTDFAFVVSFGKTDFRAEYTAVWEISLPMDHEQTSILQEFMAAKQIASSLKPSDPADVPLLQVAGEAVQRMKPAACEAALNAFYSGAFDDTTIFVEPVIRQMRRFDRLLEAAGDSVLESRYHKYAEIAPTKSSPSPRLYQRLLDEFISRGNMSIREAHAQKLSDEIEGLAAPLGLVEIRSGSYIFAPDIENHALLSTVFKLINTAGPTRLPEVIHSLRTGSFGMPEDTIYFLLAALFHGGLITLLKHNRAMPLELIRLTSVKNAEALAPGEVIGKHDRETLVTECKFLSPVGQWESFGLRQQRDVWQEVIKFRDWSQRTVSEVENRLASIAEYSAFEAFDVKSLHSQLNKLKTLHEEIKVSYGAREGLERFLKAWRHTGLAHQDIDFIKNMRTFLVRQSDQFVFVSHYIRHKAADRAASEDKSLDELRNEITYLLAHPESLVMDGEISRLIDLFNRFRISYADYYREKHGQYYAQFIKKSLPKFAKRALALLQRFASIEILDRPPGMEVFLRELKAPGISMCRRNLSEELIRSPVCSCGYFPGETPDPVQTRDPEKSIDKFLDEYLVILKNPGVREAISARIFALTDADPDTVKRLRDLNIFLEDECASSAALLDVLDDATAEEISKSLAGRVLIEKRGLKNLVSSLDGRRLAPNQVLERVKEWISIKEDSTVIAIEDDHDVSIGSRGFSVSWWPMLHPAIFKDSMREEMGNVESALEREFPAGTLRGPLARLDDAKLAWFLKSEPFHTHGIRMAWLLFAERILSGKPWPDLETLESGHADPDTAREITERLQTLKQIARQRKTPLPHRLCVRIPLSEIMTDSWVSAELHSLAFGQVRKIEPEGEEWLGTISSVKPISLEDNPIVVILDGISPDVWLETMNLLGRDIDEIKTTWHRLEVSPKTGVSISSLFGFSQDAIDELSSRGIPYLQVQGNEAYSMEDLLPPFVPGQSTVIRVSLIDKGAHASLLRLNEMPGATCRFLKKELPRLLDICAAQHRRLVMTTDHGFSLTRTGLSHGSGGVFERAIFHAEW